MNREYYKRGSGGGAVLMVHGILGTPDHFEPFLPLVPEDVTVRSLLLPGHGGPVRDFGRSSMDAWREYVHTALEELRGDHGRVLIAAHSMGTLFAIEEAVARPAEGLFLLNVPLYVGIRRRLFSNAWRVYRGTADTGDEWARAAARAYSLEPERNLLPYAMFVPRYMELFSEMRRVRGLLEKLDSPCRAYFSGLDEMVSIRSMSLMERQTHAAVTLLPRSGHDFYEKRDLEVMKQGFSRALREALTQ